MNPSSSSNADSPTGPTFKVSTRALTVDLGAARLEESARDLGDIDRSGLGALLEKLGTLDPGEVAEADPHLLVTGRRGRFTVRPARDRFVLRSATDAAQNYLELAAAEVPDFLDGAEIQPAAPPPPSAPAVVAHPAETRLALALTLFALTALIVAGSAWWTFRPDDLDPDAEYVAIEAPAEVATLRQQAAGTYGNGAGDDERTLEISSDGAVRYREYGPGHELADDRTGASRLARRAADQAIVLRVADLGPIELKNANTAVFARDAYQRRPAPAAAPR